MLSGSEELLSFLEASQDLPSIPVRLASTTVSMQKQVTDASSSSTRTPDSTRGSSVCSGNATMNVTDTMSMRKQLTFESEVQTPVKPKPSILQSPGSTSCASTDQKVKIANLQAEVDAAKASLPTSTKNEAWALAKG